MPRISTVVWINSRTGKQKDRWTIRVRQTPRKNNQKLWPGICPIVTGRLNGVWGGVRFVHSRFTFLSSRIVQKRKQWLMETLELDNAAQLPQVLGPHWWFHFGAALCEVMMSADFYKVGPQNDRRWDSLGLSAFACDCAAWPGLPSNDLINQSHFTLFRDIGGHLFGPHSREALRFAMNRMARAEPAAAPPLNPQLILDLEAAIERTKKNSSP